MKPIILYAVQHKLIIRKNPGDGKFFYINLSILLIKKGNLILLIILLSYNTIVEIFLKADNNLFFIFDR